MDGLQQIQSIMASPAVSNAQEITEEEFDLQAARLMVAAGAGDDADIEVGEDEMAKLLQKLHNEPSNDEERAAKFMLYERYADTVSDARKATLDFWAEAVLEFEGTAKALVENDIKKLDGEQNLGFFMQANQRWFVYDMVKVAHQNAGTIERLLASMRTKLELLSSQSECPICLEAFEQEQGESDQLRPTTTLSCCHKVCKDCWQQWQQINPHSAFCPLCRQEDFLMRILPGN